MCVNFCGGVDATAFFCVCCSIKKNVFDSVQPIVCSLFLPFIFFFVCFGFHRLYFHLFYIGCRSLMWTSIFGIASSSALTCSCTCSTTTSLRRLLPILAALCTLSVIQKAHVKKLNARVRITFWILVVLREKFIFIQNRFSADGYVGV